MCGSFVVGRVIYTLGYKTGNPASVCDSAFQLVLLAHSAFSEYLALSSHPCQLWVSETVTHGLQFHSFFCRASWERNVCSLPPLAFSLIHRIRDIID